MMFKRQNLPELTVSSVRVLAAVGPPAVVNSPSSVAKETTINFIVRHDRDKNEKSFFLSIHNSSRDVAKGTGEISIVQR